MLFLSTLHFLKFPENSFEVLRQLENSVEVLKIPANKLESMKIPENKLESLKLQENRPVDGLGGSKGGSSGAAVVMVAAVGVLAATVDGGYGGGGGEWDMGSSISKGRGSFWVRQKKPAEKVSGSGGWPEVVAGRRLLVGEGENY
nr:hypothetical protein [Tanacetum cinerariifolium]